MDDVELIVRQAIANQLALECELVGLDDGLKHLSMDSLELVNVVTRLEDTYYIKVPNVDLSKLYAGTVGDVVVYIQTAVDVELFRHMNLVWGATCSPPCWDHSGPCPWCIPSQSLLCAFHSA